MKTMSRLKKVVALGMGLTMVGATLFGASAAKLSDFPAPFIKDGVPASNLAVVVGDQAAASDVVGMGDIIQQLQAAAVVKSKTGGAATAPRVKLVGDAVEVGTPNDLLEMYESIGKVRPSLTEYDLNLLKGGSISTKRGVTKYNQYLKFTNFGTNTNSSKVIFAEDEFDNVGHFLFWKDTDQLFQWTMEFEEGLLSDFGTFTASGSSGGSNPQSFAPLVDLRDRDLNILGNTYTVVDTSFSNQSTSARAKLTLLGGAKYDALGEGDKKTYTVGGKEYEVEVVVISESANEVLLKVNGETLPRMKLGEVEPTSDGLLVGVRDIIATGKDTQSSVVRLYLGATKMELTDNDYTDASFTSSGLLINNEQVETAGVRVRGTLASDGSKVTLNSLDINVTSNALVGDMYVPPGHGVREYLDEPEAMITPNWDVKYEGLLDTGTTTIKLNPVGRDEYKLEFTNQEGLHCVVPFLSTRQDGSIRLGEFSAGRARVLHTNEDTLGLPQSSTSALAAVAASVTLGDYFLLSDISSSGRQGAFDGNSGGAGGDTLNASGTPGFGNQANISWIPSGNAGGHTDNTAFSRLLKYESVDTTNKVLTFTDCATGTKQVTWSETSGTNQSTLIVGGNSYTVFVGNTSVSTGLTNITVDLNGDGIFNASTVAVIATQGGGLIVPPALNDTNAGLVGRGLAQPGVAAGTGQGVAFGLNTLSKQFDSSSADEVISVNLTTRSSNQIGVQNIFSSDGSTLTFLTSEPEIAQLLTTYGTFVEMYRQAGSTTPEQVTIEYPLSERGVQVFVTAGEIQTAAAPSGGETEKVQPLGAVAKLASEVKDITAVNAIVVGGPCVNIHAATLLGNPKECAAGFTPGKALIKLFEHSNGNVALLVAGHGAQDTRGACRALKGKLPDAKEAEVTVRSLSDVTVKAV